MDNVRATGVPSTGCHWLACPAVPTKVTKSQLHSVFPVVPCSYGHCLVTEIHPHRISSEKTDHCYQLISVRAGQLQYALVSKWSHLSNTAGQASSGTPYLNLSCGALSASCAGEHSPPSCACAARRHRHPSPARRSA